MSDVYFYPIPQRSIEKRFSEVFNTLSSGKSCTLIGSFGNGRTSHLRFITSQHTLLSEFGLSPESHITIHFDIERTQGTYVSFLSDMLISFIKVYPEVDSLEAQNILLTRDSYLMSQKILSIISTISKTHSIVIILSLNSRCETYINELDRFMVMCTKSVTRFPVSILWSVDISTAYIYKTAHSSSTFLSRPHFHSTFTQEETQHSLTRRALSESTIISKAVLAQCMHLTGGISALFPPLLRILNSKDDIHTLQVRLHEDYAVKRCIDTTIQEIELLPEYAEHCISRDAYDFLHTHTTSKQIPEVYGIQLRSTPSSQDIRILTLLHENRGKAVNREQIAEVLWSKDFLSSYSDWAIAKAISRLREKLPKNIKIITIKNYGYQLYVV